MGVPWTDATLLAAPTREGGAMPDNGANGVGWRGFHHVAVVTRDLEETIRFYEDVLGMSAGDVIEKGRPRDRRPALLYPAR